MEELFADWDSEVTEWIANLIAELESASIKIVAFAWIETSVVSGSFAIDLAFVVQLA